MKAYEDPFPLEALRGYQDIQPQWTIQIIQLRRITKYIQHKTQTQIEQEWTKDPKMHHTVKTAQNLVRDLTKTIAKQKEEHEHEYMGQEDELVVKDAQRILEEVEMQLTRLKLPSFCRPAAAYGARKYSGATNPALGQKKVTKQTGEKADEDVRIASTIIAPRVSTSDSDQKVKMHQEMHEHLSEEILHLAAGLKKNALNFQKKLEDNSHMLDSTENYVEANLADAKQRVKQAKAFYKRNWSTTCYMYIMLFWVGVVFVFMYMFIKMTSFAGYTNVQTVTSEL